MQIGDLLYPLMPDNSTLVINALIELIYKGYFKINEVRLIHYIVRNSIGFTYKNREGRYDRTIPTNPKSPTWNLQIQTKKKQRR